MIDYDLSMMKMWIQKNFWHLYNVLILTMLQSKSLSIASFLIIFVKPMNNIVNAM